MTTIGDNSNPGGIAAGQLCPKKLADQWRDVPHYGADGRKLRNPIARLFDAIVVTPVGCWQRTSAILSTGYSLASIGSKRELAHRLAWKMTRGPIQEGLVIDHLCRNRLCINPNHLQPVTQSINVRRGLSPQTTIKRQLAKTHCPRGHPYSGPNLYTLPSGGRACRICADVRRANFELKRGRRR